MAKVEGIDTICVVGAGAMGRQIALCSALAGYRAYNVDKDPAALEKARQFKDTYLPGRVSLGKLDGEAARRAVENLHFTTSLEEGAREADLVIEAIPEVFDLKWRLFSQLDKICPEHTILATNSSFIVTSRLKGATGRPGKTCNMHFFVPPITMLPVEVVKGPHTYAETAETVAAVCRSMGKVPIMLDKEIHGFLVNRILAAAQREALLLYDLGVASYHDIDTAVAEGLGHKIPPFRQMDLIGLDLVLLIAKEHYRETGSPLFKPSPAVVEMVAQKRLGRKSGKGFYDYSGMLSERGY